MAIHGDSMAERLEALRRQVAESPLDAEAHIKLGNALALAGVRLQAVDALRRAVSIAPTNPMAHQSLALVYDALEEWELATQHHLRALFYGADNMATEFELGWSALHDPEYFLQANAYELIEEIGRRLARRRIRDGKLTL